MADKLSEMLRPILFQHLISRIQGRLQTSVGLANSRIKDRCWLTTLS